MCVCAGGEAVGVRLAPRGGRGERGSGEVIRARRAVVSNASAWDTQRLLPPGAAPPAWRDEALQTPRTGSFVHLHAGALLGFIAFVPRVFKPQPALACCGRLWCRQLLILCLATQVLACRALQYVTCGRLCSRPMCAWVLLRRHRRRRPAARPGVPPPVCQQLGAHRCAPGALAAHASRRVCGCTWLEGHALSE